MVPSAFEPNMLLNTYLAMLFKYILTATGVLEALPGYFAVLPIPTWLTFALLVFFASLVGGGTAILAISIPLARFSGIGIAMQDPIWYAGQEENWKIEFLRRK